MLRLGRNNVGVVGMVARPPFEQGPLNISTSRYTMVNRYKPLSLGTAKQVDLLTKAGSQKAIVRREIPQLSSPHFTADVRHIFPETDQKRPSGVSAERSARSRPTPGCRGPQTAVRLFQ
jgi:hypothetical protein